MKPFATLGSEISKVRERVRRSAEALRPAKVASDVREQRDRLLAKLGEQTFRLIAERKLQVPRVLQDSVEKLAALLGVQVPPPAAGDEDFASVAPDPPSATETLEDLRERAIDGAVAVASDPLDEPAEIDEPALGDEPPPAPAEPPAQPARSPSPDRTPRKTRASGGRGGGAKKKGSKARGKR
jgi:hypothetical protein